MAAPEPRTTRLSLREALRDPALSGASSRFLLQLFDQPRGSGFSQGGRHLDTGLLCQCVQIAALRTGHRLVTSRTIGHVFGWRLGWRMLLVIGHHHQLTIEHTLSKPWVRWTTPGPYDHQRVAGALRRCATRRSASSHQ